MPDKETVIDKLNDMADYLLNKSYSDLLARDFYDTVGYAIALLKEQEADKPILRLEGRNKYYNVYVCPRCDNEVIYGQNYCSECGVRFMWEGR